MAVMSFNQRVTLALTVFAEHAREQDGRRSLERQTFKHKIQDRLAWSDPLTLSPKDR